MDARLNVDDEKEYDRNVIYTCCSKSSMLFIKFVAQCVISFIALIFSFAMLLYHPSSNDSLYFSIIMLIIGVFIPSPSHK